MTGSAANTPTNGSDGDDDHDDGGDGSASGDVIDDDYGDESEEISDSQLVSSLMRLLSILM